MRRVSSYTSDGIIVVKLSEHRVSWTGTLAPSRSPRRILGYEGMSGCSVPMLKILRVLLSHSVRLPIGNYQHTVNSMPVSRAWYHLEIPTVPSTPRSVLLSPIGTCRTATRPKTHRCDNCYHGVVTTTTMLTSIRQVAQSVLPRTRCPQA